MRVRKPIDRSTEIVVMNNINGATVLRDRDFKTVLYNYGDVEYFTFDELRRMVSFTRSVFNDLKVVIIGVEGDYSVEDVANSLGLGDAYQGNIDWDGLKSFIADLDYIEYQDFMDTLTKEQRDRVAEITVTLIRENNIPTINYERTLNDYYGDNILFEEILKERESRA